MLRLSFVAFMILSLLTFGCGGGGGGSDTVSPTETPATLYLSSDNGIPGTFITLEDNFIKKGEDLNVTFSDSSGFEVTLRSLLVEDGSAKIPIPPHIGEETGDFEAGNVTISIANGNQADFQIEALPDIVDLEVGYVYKAYLEVIRDSFEAHLLNMDDIEAVYGYDTEEMKDQIQMQIDDIEYTLNELDTTGTVSYDSEHFGKSILSESDLKTVDQLLYAKLMGLYNEGNSESSASRNVGEKTLDEWIDYFRRGAILIPGNTLSDHNDSFRANTNAVEAYLEALASKAGWAGRAVYSKTLKPTAMLAKALLQEALSAATDAERFVSEGELTVSQETKALARKVARKVSEAYGLDILLKTEDHYNTLSPIAKWILKIKCEIGVGDFSFFCDNTEKSRLQVVTAYFKPTVVLSGTPAHLNFSITDTLVSLDLARNSKIHIDWGDGDGSILRWGESHSHKNLIGRAEREHSYHLESDEVSRTYTAQVIVSGDNDDYDYKHYLWTKIQVVNVIDPITIDFQGSTLLNINELGKWTMDVSGGVGPYKGKIKWGDGKGGTDIRPEGKFKGSHRYKTAGVRTIILDITDSDGETASINFSVTVVAEETPADLAIYNWVSMDINFSTKYITTYEDGDVFENTSQLWDEYGIVGQDILGSFSGNTFNGVYDPNPGQPLAIRQTLTVTLNNAHTKITDFKYTYDEKFSDDVYEKRMVTGSNIPLYAGDAAGFRFFLGQEMCNEVSIKHKESIDTGSFGGIAVVELTDFSCIEETHIFSIVFGVTQDN